MDPDANLIEQRKVAKRIIALIDGTPDGEDIDANELECLANRMADLVLALDKWTHRTTSCPHPERHQTKAYIPCQDCTPADEKGFEDDRRGAAHLHTIHDEDEGHA